jgi:hypothetical protein
VASRRLPDLGTRPAGRAHPLSNRRVYYNCRFWYVNEYYQTTSARGWQTRIAAFRLPGCT